MTTSKTLQLGIRQNALWSICGEATFAIGQLCLLVVLARLGSRELVGQYAWALAVSTPVFLFFSLQFRTILAATPQATEQFGSFVRVRLSAIALALAVSIFIAVAWDPGTAKLVVAVAFAKSVDSLSDILFGLFWHRNRMDLIARSQILRGIGSLSSFSLVFYLSENVVYAAFSTVAVYLLILLLYDLPMAFRNTSALTSPAFINSFQRCPWKELIAIGLPAGLLSCLGSLEVYIPRYFLKASIGDGQLGTFTALASTLIGFEMIARSLNSAAIPRLSEMYEKRNLMRLNEVLMKLFLAGATIASVLVLGTFLVGKLLIGIVFGAEYAAEFHVLLILMGASVLRLLAFPLAMSLRAMKAYRLLTLNQLIATTVLIVTCWILVPRYELAGCATAVTIGLAVDIVGRCVLHFWHLRRRKEITSQSQRVLSAA